jgi:hypothetical protein
MISGILLGELRYVLSEAPEVHLRILTNHDLTQTFGGPFGSDGRIQGQEFIYTVDCDTTNNVCPVTVPAPGAALVFLSPQAQKASEPTATLTYSTSLLTVSFSSLLASLHII